MDETKDKPILTPQEVAALLNVAPVTVRAWAQKGLLAACTTPGGHRRFPREEVERFARENGLWLPPKTSPRPPRVLIVDDDRQVAGYLVEFLRGLEPPVAVEAVHDGFAAGYQVHGFKPDMVLLDLMMPGMDGFQVCRRIKQEASTAAVRVIAMTGFPTPEHQQRILEAGAECCLPKPLDESVLLAVLGLGREAR